jgi:hypothetical protein
LAIYSAVLWNCGKGKNMSQKPDSLLLLAILTSTLFTLSGCEPPRNQGAIEVKEEQAGSLKLNQKEMIAKHELPDPYLTPGAVRTTNAMKSVLARPAISAKSQPEPGARFMLFMAIWAAIILASALLKEVVKWII